MKITKYPQSCFVIQTKDAKILIDPGKIKFEDAFLEEWKDANFVLISHKHSDHFNIDVLKNLKKHVYSSMEVKNLIKYSKTKGLKICIFKKWQKIKLGKTLVTAVPVVHGFLPKMKAGGYPKKTLGFVVDDGEQRVFFTSDTICFNNKIKADVVIAPITGNGITMSPYECAEFTKDCGAHTLIACHLDNPQYYVNLDDAKKIFSNSPQLKVIFPELRQTIEI